MNQAETITYSNPWDRTSAKAEAETQKIFQATTRERNQRQGFTLIEIMIVLAILSAVLVLGLPYLRSRNSETKTFLRELTVLSRELHTKAKLNGATYRLVIDLTTPGRDSSSNEPQRFWVERARKGVVVSERDEERAQELAKETDKEKRQDPRGFTVDDSVLKRERTVPSGLRIEQVEISRLKNPIRTGKAFIHYLHQGLVDEAAIHVKGKDKQSWTISIHPLTGKAELITKTVGLKDLKSQ